MDRPLKLLPSSSSETAVPLKPLAGLVCTGLAVVSALLICAPDPMIKGWGMGLLESSGIEAPLLWFLVLDAPDLWHVLIFALLTISLLVAMPTKPRLCLTTALLLSVFLEAAQVFIPSRTAGVVDLLYNLAGVCLAFVAFRFFRPLARVIGVPRV